MKLSIIDYGVGNLLSVRNAVEFCGFDAEFVSQPEEILEAERLILPGVGAFEKAMCELDRRNLIKPLNEAVLQKKTPILGICLGMQLMAERSEEGNLTSGLGWFKTAVVKVTPKNPALKIPQIGWNNVVTKAGSPLFAELPKDPAFYFVHSYHLDFADGAPEVEAFCDYGGRVTAAVRKDHIFATQFHPEKSSTHGLKVLENFLTWKAE